MEIVMFPAEFYRFVKLVAQALSEGKTLVGGGVRAYKGAACFVIESDGAMVEAHKRAITCAYALVGYCEDIALQVK